MSVKASIITSAYKSDDNARVLGHFILSQFETLTLGIVYVMKYINRTKKFLRGYKHKEGKKLVSAGILFYLFTVKSRLISLPKGFGVKG